MSRLEFLIPDIGEGLSDVEIVEWLVAAGDRVTADQALVMVQTDKATVEIPAPAAGRLAETRGAAGDKLAVGSILAVLDIDEPRADDAGRPAEATPLSKSSPHRDVDHDPPAGVRRVLASPSTRKLALDLGIDLANVRGTGPGGRLTKSDVQAAAPDGQAHRQVSPSPASSRVSTMDEDMVVPLRGVRRQIARTMTQSWQQIPHVTELRELDATELVRAHNRLREHLQTRGVHLTFLPFFVRAVAAALRRHPSFNASLDMEAETITQYAGCHIGIAMAMDEGLVVPVVRDADRASLSGLAQSIETLSVAARGRSLSPRDFQGATFTVTNYGSFGVWLGTPIIRPPEVAIAGFGRIRDAVIPVDGVPAVRPVLPIAVSADHRLNDGQHLAAFMDAVATYLREPILLLGDP